MSWTCIQPSGSVLYSEEFKIEFETNDWIRIKYAYIVMLLKFQLNLDTRVSKVAGSDSILNFINGCDEGLS